MKNDPWEIAHKQVAAVKYDPIADSRLRYVDFSDGVQEEEAVVLNKWIAAFVETHGHLPSTLAVRVFTSQVDPVGPRSYARKRDTGEFLGRSPHPLPDDQLEPEPEPETERPDPAQLLRQAQSLIAQALAEIQ